MELNWDELTFIEEAVEELWDKVNHYPNDYSSEVANGLYEKVKLAKKQLESERRQG